VWELQPKVAQIRCITICQSDTKSNAHPNHNPNPTTKRHAIVNIRLNMITCPTYPDSLHSYKTCCCTVCTALGFNCHTTASSLGIIVGQCTDCEAAGFTYVPSMNGCYKVVTRNLNWSAAGQECRSLHRDAHLLVIDNAQEQWTVARLISSSSGQYSRRVVMSNCLISVSNVGDMNCSFIIYYFSHHFCCIVKAYSLLYQFVLGLRTSSSVNPH